VREAQGQENAQGEERTVKLDKQAQIFYRFNEIIIIVVVFFVYLFFRFFFSSMTFYRELTEQSFGIVGLECSYDSYPVPTIEGSFTGSYQCLKSVKYIRFHFHG